MAKDIEKKKKKKNVYQYGHGNDLLINGVKIGEKDFSKIVSAVLNGISYSASAPSVRSFLVGQDKAKRSDSRYGNQSGINFSLQDGFRITSVQPGRAYDQAMRYVNPQLQRPIAVQPAQILPFETMAQMFNDGLGQFQLGASPYSQPPGYIDPEKLYSM